MWSKKIGCEWHDLSEISRLESDLLHAWHFHLLSLISTGGWQFLFYSRNFLFKKCLGDKFSRFLLVAVI